MSPKKSDQRYCHWSTSYQGDRLDGGHKGADERSGALLNGQAFLAIVTVGLPPGSQPVLLQGLHDNQE